MANYELLYKIPGEDVTEIKISPGIMLLIHARQGGFVPLQVGNTASKQARQSGTEDAALSHPHHTLLFVRLLCRSCRLRTARY